MTMDSQNWTQDDYRTFVLLYAASVDANLDEDEMAFIEERSQHHNVKEIQRFSDKLSDIECLEIIEAKRDEFYPGETGKNQLMSELTALCKSDGVFSQLEHVVLKGLNRVL